MNETCSVCGGPLKACAGTQLNVKDGVTVYCPNTACGMADWGHGKNEKEALEVYKQKCDKSQKGGE